MGESKPRAASNVAVMLPIVRATSRQKCPTRSHPSERTRNGESKRCRLLAKFFPIGGRCGSPATAQDSAAQGLKARRSNERRLRHRQARYSGVRLAEIQSVGKVNDVGSGVARSE